MSSLTLTMLAAAFALDLLALTACFAIIGRRKDRGEW